MNLDLRQDIMLTVKVQAISALVEQMTGEKPVVVYLPDRVKMSFTPAQKVILQKYIESRLSMKTDNKLEIDLLPVVAPAFMHVYGKFIVGGIFLAFLAGKMFSKGSR
jgi:hypothetical protein